MKGVDPHGLDAVDFQDVLPGLSIEASQWRSASDELFNLRNTLVRSFEDEARDTELAFNALLNYCAENLNNVKITKTLPSNIIQEREEYRDSILKSIDRDRGCSFTASDMLSCVEEIVTGVIDYGTGPLKAYRFIENFADNEAIKKVKVDDFKNTCYYYITFEKNRNDRRIRMGLLDKGGREPRDKVVGHGFRNNYYPTSDLIFGLNEYVQNKEQLIGLSGGEVEKAKEEVGKKLRDFVDMRKRFRKSTKYDIRARESVHGILLEDDAVLKMIVDEIKPRTPLDLISAHPVQQKIRNLIRKHEELLDRKKAILELYMLTAPGRHCSQSVIYDVILDLVYGGRPEERLWVLDTYQRAWGYPPLPGFVGLLPERVIDPSRNGFKLYRVLPELQKYDVKKPSRCMIV
jgi:hypothetical protein